MSAESTQQPLILEPGTLRYAVTAPSAANEPSIRPEAEGLLRPKIRNTNGLLRHNKRTRFRFAGLVHPVAHRKYEGMERTKAHGGSIRLLSPAEIDEWYTRLAAIQQGGMRPRGPLADSKTR